MSISYVDMDIDNHQCQPISTKTYTAMNSNLVGGCSGGGDECLMPHGMRSAAKSLWPCKTIVLGVLHDGAGAVVSAEERNGGCFVHDVLAERSIFRLQALGTG